MVEAESEDKVLMEMLLEDVRSRGGDHPDPDLLLAYLEGEVEPTDEERLRDHLAGCRECTELLLDLDTISGEQPALEEGVEDFELGAAWRQMQEQVKENHATSGRWLRRLLPPIAAALALVSVGLSMRVVQLGRIVEGLRATATVARVRVNPPNLFLDPMTRDGAGTATLGLAEDDELVVLNVTPADLGSSDAYDVEIVTAEGTMVSRKHNATLNDHMNLQLVVSSSMLPAGSYEVRLFGRQAGKTVPAGEYPFRVGPLSQ